MTYFSRFVCATSQQTASTVALSNYYSSYHDTRLWNKTSIWEAARATSAASSFFEPITIAGETFIDGATGANNPIQQLWTEAIRTWRDEGQQGKWHLEDNISCLISIGTGVPSLTPFGNDVKQIGKALLAIALDTEDVAETFQQHHTDLYRMNHAFRFNVLRGLENIGLEDYVKMDSIDTLTRKYNSMEDTRVKMEESSKRLKERFSMSQFH